MVVGLLGAVETWAGTPAFEYGRGRSRPLRACILLMPSARWENAEPMFLPALTDPTLGRLNIENPLAPETITTPYEQMWRLGYRGPVTFGTVFALVDNDPTRLQQYLGQAHLEGSHYYPQPYIDQQQNKPPVKKSESLATFYKPLDAKVEKSDAQYWELPLIESTVTELTNFDAVFFNTHRLLYFTRHHLDLLQRFLDAGGVLFLENSHGCRVPVEPAVDTNGDGIKDDAGNSPAQDPIHSLFFLKFQFMDSYPQRKGQDWGYQPAEPDEQEPFEYQNAPFPINPGGMRTVPKRAVDRTHPLLAGLIDPRQNNENQPLVDQLGDVLWHDHLLLPFVSVSGRDTDGFGIKTRDLLQELVQTTRPNAVTGDCQPAVAAGWYGSGLLVLSGVDMIDDTSSTLEWKKPDPNNPNQWIPAKSRSQQDGTEGDFRFMTNLLNWKRKSWPMWRGSPRHTGVTSGTAGPQLGIHWQFPAEGEANFLGPVYSSPVTLRGILYFAAGDKRTNTYRLFALDADPAADRDGDGQAEDTDQVYGYVPGSPEFLDYSLDKPYDVIWAADLAGGQNLYNTPAVGSITVMANGGTRDDQTRPVEVVAMTSRDRMQGTSGNSFLEVFYACLDPYINVFLNPNQPLQPGTRLWRETLPNTLGISSPVIHKGKVYVVVINNDLANGYSGEVRAYSLSDVDGDGRSDQAWIYPGRYEDRRTGSLIIYPREQRNPFGWPEAFKPLSTPVVARLVNPQSGLGYDAVIAGAPNGYVYTVSFDPDLFRVSLRDHPVSGVSVDGNPLAQWEVEDDDPYQRYHPNPDERDYWLRLDRSAGGQMNMEVKFAGGSSQPIGKFPSALQVVGLPELDPNKQRLSVNASPAMVEENVAVCASPSTQGSPIPLGGLSFISLRSPSHHPELDPATKPLWSYNPLLLFPQGEWSNWFVSLDASPVYAHRTVIAPATLMQRIGNAAVDRFGGLVGIDPQASLTFLAENPLRRDISQPLTQSPEEIQELDRIHIAVEALSQADNGKPFKDIQGGTPPYKKLIHPSMYNITYQGATNELVVTFDLANAHGVTSIDGEPLGPVYGKQVYLVVDYNRDGKWNHNDPGKPPGGAGSAAVDYQKAYTVPSLPRWEYLPYLVRVPTWPVNPASVSVSPGFSYTLDAPYGLFRFTGNAAGQPVTITYTDVYGRTFTVRRIVPPPYGPITSSPVYVEDTGTLFVGTRAFDLNGNRTVAENMDEQGRLMAFHFGEGDLITATAFPDSLPYYPNLNVTRLDFYSSPLVLEDKVFIGGTLNNGAGGVLYCFGLDRLLVVDSKRLVELDELGNVQWECDAANEPNPVRRYTEIIYPKGQGGGGDRPQDYIQQPFASIATALESWLPEEYLVVDTDRHRVVGLNRQGDVTWPLNHTVFLAGNQVEERRFGLMNFGLNRPTDATYFTRREWARDENGNLIVDADGQPVLFPITHVLIADRGNRRVLDVRTWIYPWNYTDPNDPNTVLFSWNVTRYDSYDDQGNWVHQPVVVTPPAEFNPQTQQWQTYTYRQVRLWNRSAVEQSTASPTPTVWPIYVCLADNVDQLKVIQNGQFLYGSPWWFANRTLRGLRFFEAFSHAGVGYFAFIDRGLDPVYPGEPAIPSDGHPVLRMYYAADPTQARWTLTKGEYLQELEQYYGRKFTADGSGIDSNERALWVRIRDSRSWNPQSVSKVPGATQVMVVNAGLNAPNQPLSRNEVLVYDFTAPAGQRLRWVLPDATSGQPPGTYPFSLPRVARSL